ncbi:MAG: lamin tail domain-containing protein [Actinomycetota bacterium]|nr:lamin tail domain-containing protein [Actinomycetota bacterium]
MTTSLLRGVAAVAAALALAVPASVPAATATELQTWYGTVVHISDGDTFEVDVDDDGLGPVVVRMTGVQAMEMHKSTSEPPECHAAEAEASLGRLIDGKRVRLSAVDADSRGLRNRLVRFVEVYRDGVWRDVNLAQLRRGHALWMPHPTETVRHLTYNRAAAAAAARGAALWDIDTCGAGPHHSVPLELWAQWDADSKDALNVNGEWVKLRNRSTTETLTLDGWSLRDTALREYRFPSDTSVPPGQTLTVHVGVGTDSGLTRYWGLSAPIFENVPADRSLGDGAYLFDPDGDLRAWFTYPCARLCSDPLRDQVVVSAVQYKSPESIQLRNVGTASVDLYGYLLESWPYGYDFPEGSTLAPGETLTVAVGCPTDSCAMSRLKQYWYKYGDPNGQFLDNTGDAVRLRTFDGIKIDCGSWGTGTC